MGHNWPIGQQYKNDLKCCERTSYKIILLLSHLFLTSSLTLLCFSAQGLVELLSVPIASNFQNFPDFV